MNGYYPGYLLDLTKLPAITGTFAWQKIESAEHVGYVDDKGVGIPTPAQHTFIMTVKDLHHLPGVLQPPAPPPVPEQPALPEPPQE